MQSTKERLLAAVARYAKGKKGRLVGLEFKRFARVCDRTLQVHFDGGFAGLVKAAGLEGKVRRVNIPEEDLLKAYHGLVERLGRHPKWHEVMREGPHMPAVYFTRFGRTRQVRERYEAWRGDRAKAGERLAELKPEPLRTRAKVAPRPIEDFPLGEPVGHKWVLHAPTNEAGVIHLFGVMAPQMGYAVAGIRAGYPDCLAYKARAGAPGRWKPVRIEFELRSSNFRMHGHDPKGCDEIVCWEDDWRGCPVKVVELRRELERVGRVGASNGA